MWVQTARPTIAGELLDFLALVLRPRFMRFKLFDCPQVVTAQLLHSGLQHTSQESVWFSQEVSLLACRPRNNTRMTNMTNHDSMH